MSNAPATGPLGGPEPNLSYWMGKIDNKLNGIDHKLDRMAERQDKSDERMDNFEKRLAKVESDKDKEREKDGNNITWNWFGKEAIAPAIISIVVAVVINLLLN